MYIVVYYDNKHHSVTLTTDSPVYVLHPSIHKSFQLYRSPLLNIKPPEPGHEISNNVLCATSKASDQPAHTRSLIRAFASRLSI